MERAGFAGSTTNNRMELCAVIEALKAVSSHGQWAGRPVTIRTDSQYVQKGITEWIHAWVRKDWKTSAKKPVKNVDLWSELWGLSRGMPVQWVWVMGHAGDDMNEACHLLVEAAVSKGLKRGA
jgi:ribonuclease HI